MKSFLLTAVILITGASTIFAQNMPPVYSWEVGISGGYGAITRPLGPATGYQGTSTNVVPDFSLHLNYFFNEHWMLGLDAGTRRWETYGKWQVNDRFNTKLKPVDVDFLEADRAINESIQMSYVIPFYTQFQTYNRANLYFGVAAGLITTVNDGSKGFSTVKSPIDSANITYISSYHYGFGIGYSLGIHAGYTYNIVPRLGINIELGMRYAHVNTNDQEAYAGNSKYYLLYFPETIGIRWRF